MARTRGPTCEKCGLSRRGRRFPLQIGDQDRRLAREAERAGKPGPDLRASIPWEVAERAWAIYHARYPNDQNVERMAERAGFSNGEMDDFLPGWRELADEWDELRRKVQELSQRLIELNGRLETIHEEAESTRNWETVLEQSEDPI